MGDERIERLKQWVQNPRFISGIHNYCDRWCQRCTMTSRCSIFVPEELESGAGTELDQEELWRPVMENLELAGILLHEMAEEAGIDLDALVDAEGDVRDVPKPDFHILVHSASKYRDGVRRWLEALEGPLAERRKQGKRGERRRLRPAGQVSLEAQIDDWLEIVLWYHTLIPPKLHRAVQPDPLEGMEGMEDFPRDADGSAKVALISMDRSLAAWIGLLEAAPEAKEEILGFIQQLERLRRATEWTFPDARAFVRPGFDDMPEE
jgi:hypothetical protein